MNRIGWILVALALLLFLVSSSREGFAVSEKVKDWPTLTASQKAEEITRVRELLKAQGIRDTDYTDAEIESILSAFLPAWKSASGRITTADVLASLQTTAPADKNKKKVLLEVYYIDQNTDLFASAYQAVAGITSVIPPTPPPLITTPGEQTPTTPPVVPPHTDGVPPPPLPPGTSALGPSMLPKSGFQKGIWGPEFTGFGADIGPAGSPDTSASRQYPMIYGPNPTQERSKEITDAGQIVYPRDSAVSFDLPSSTQTGSDPQSQYFPWSRVPGDQEGIPDPWRVSQTWTPSTQSYKTNPVPFLADFSAFF